MDKIYKITCENCKINTYSNERESFCLNCKELKEHSEVINPIEKVKPRCLVITKSFKELNPITYSNEDVLHIGISNSKGEVFNFWKNYCIEDHQSNKIWKKVINVELELLREDLIYDDKLFDFTLLTDFLNQKAMFPQYDQFDNNCYSYVCRFLNCINYAGEEWSKESVAINLIEQRISYLEKFSSLCKKIENVKDRKIKESLNEPQYTNSVCDICNNRIIIGERFRCTICPDFDLCLNCNKETGHSHSLFKI